MWIDIHHHLLWGLDDGSRSEEMTREMLRCAAEQQVEVIAATTHAAPGSMRFRMAEYRERLAQANAWLRETGLPVRVVSGCEIFYTPHALRFLTAGEIPTLNETRWVLVEFSPGDSFDTLEGAARTLTNAGYRVVMAHIERYECLRRLERVAMLRDEYNVWTQVNASTLIEPHGFFRKRWLRQAMDRELVDVAATDAHNLDSRRCRLQACYEAISRTWGRETADSLCRYNPAHVLGLEV